MDEIEIFDTEAKSEDDKVNNVENVEILVGTYEEYVIGYRIAKGEEGEVKLDQTFTSRAHCGPVRSLTALSKYCISGGSDELCKVFDMTNRTEHGTLMHHEGTVSCLSAQGQHLLSASDDNSLAILRAGSWQVEKTLYKHSAGITALAVHPTGKIAFTAAKDKKLITWNLVKARPAFITNLKGIAEFIEVSPDGSRFAVGLHRRVDIYSLDTAGVEYTIELKARPNCLLFLSDTHVVVGGESRELQVHSITEKKVITTWLAHQTRVRCLLLLPDGRLVSASSCDGSVKLWDISSISDREASLVCSAETQCRVTCLTMWHPGMRQVEGKKKRKKPKEPESNSTEDNSKSESKKVKIASVGGEIVTPTGSVQLIEEQEVTLKPKVKKKKSKAESAVG